MHGSDVPFSVPLPYHYRTITIPLPPPLVPPLPPFDQIFTIIFGSYVLIIGVLTCALVGVASRWCDIAADCRCGAKTITLPPPTPPRAQGGYCAAPLVRPRATRRPSCWTAPTPPNPQSPPKLYTIDGLTVRSSSNPKTTKSTERKVIQGTARKPHPRTKAEHEQSPRPLQE